MNSWKDSLLEGVHEVQLAAITAPDGPQMIIAGAGTGKTMVITRRIAWLLAEEKAKPDEILALTFTEKAAREMEERVDRLLPIGYVDTSICTFHAFCERVLSRHGLEMGFPGNMRILTETDAWLLLRKHLKRFELDYFRPRGNPTKFLREMLKHFSRCKDEGVIAEKYVEHVEELWQKQTGGTPEGFAQLPLEARLELTKWKELAGAYTLYEKILAEESAIDFGGLLLGVQQLFSHRPNILALYRLQYKYVIVDEFQDTNSIQYMLVKQLVGEKRNVTVVGDDDQSIYKFRGAALANILQFRTDFPDCQRFVLTENYRSGKQVLDAAYRLIRKNDPHRLEISENISKELRSHQEGEGFVTHIHADTLQDEVQAVAHEIIERVTSGSASWGDFCILSRAHDPLAPFLETFDRYGIPYVHASSSGLYTKPLIIDLLAYLRITADPLNNTAWYRIITHPRLGISPPDVHELLSFVRRKAYSFADAMQRDNEMFGVSSGGRERLLEFLEMQKVFAEKNRRCSAAEIFIEIVKKSGLLGDIKGLPEMVQKEQFQYVEEFLGRLKRFVESNPGEASLSMFLEEFDAEREAGEEGSLPKDEEAGPDVVQMMTVHSAKGLEFRYVFVVNLVEQRFPSVSRSEFLPLPPGLVPFIAELDDHIAEERRLFYVAMTRAKEGLFLLSADDYGGARTRKPSRFLLELDIDKTRPEKRGDRALREAAAQDPEHDPDDRKDPSQSSGSYEREQHTLLSLPEEMSFSQIAAFTTCPLQYKYAHLLKIPTFGKHQFSFGQTMHGTLQKYLEQLQDMQAQAQVKIPTLATLLEIYEATFIDEWYPSPEVKTEYREKGREICKTFYEQMRAETPKPWKLECGFHLRVEDVVLKGRIDRIDAIEGGYEIIDYKTGVPKDELAWDDKRQLVMYALAAEQCFNPPLKVLKLTYYYLENGSTVSFTPTEKEKEKLRSMVIETVSDLKASDFTATPSDRVCKHCDFKDICPAAKLG
ncbi:MAG: ATP-dependent DNA helicase [Patescibacteria group bacterium]